MLKGKRQRSSQLLFASRDAWGGAKGDHNRISTSPRESTRDEWSRADFGQSVGNCPRVSPVEGIPNYGPWAGNARSSQAVLSPWRVRRPSRAVAMSRGGVHRVVES